MILRMNNIKVTKFIRKSILVLTILLSVITCGCDRETAWIPSDTDVIFAYIEDHPEVFYDYFFDTAIDSSTSPSFYREVLSIEGGAVIETVIVDTFPLGCEVSVIDSIEGVFHVYDSGVWYDTSFTAVGKTHAYFEKWGGSGDPYCGWLLRKISQSIIYSIPLFSPYFTLSVTSSGDGVSYNYTSTNNSMIGLSSFPLTLSAGDTAYLHLTSIDKTNYVYLHYYDGSNLKKVRFIDTGTTLDAQFVVSGQVGTYRHFFIDIVYKNSVGPPAGNYKAKTWGILYKIQ